MTQFMPGYLYTSKSPRRECVFFKSDVPLNESCLNPRIVYTDKVFSQDYPATIHEAIVYDGPARFLIIGYQTQWGPRNRALESVLPDVIWSGEIAVLFLGIRSPFIQSPSRSPSRSIGR